MQGKRELQPSPEFSVMFIAIRKILEIGYTPEELAEILGDKIDLIAGDIRNEARIREAKIPDEIRFGIKVACRQNTHCGFSSKTTFNRRSNSKK